MSKRSSWILLICIALISIFTFSALVITESSLQIGRSDFTASYVGGKIIQSGIAHQLYNETVQGQIHGALIYPDKEGNLPFVYPPVLGLIVAPFTSHPLDVTFRIFSILELGLLILSVGLVLRTFKNLSLKKRLGIAIISFGGAGPGILVLQAQWSAITALGVSLSFVALSRDKLKVASFALVFCALLFKPHLALGLLAFLVGWRNRQMLIGSCAAVLSILAVNLPVAGPSGLTNFLHEVLHSSGQWKLVSFVGLWGLPGGILGNSTAAQALGALLSLIALLCCYVLGVRVRHGLLGWQVALAVATILSLLAAPHVYFHDLAILAVVVAWSLAQRPTGMMMGAWGAYMFASLLLVGSSVPGLIIPLLLLGLAHSLYPSWQKGKISSPASP